MKADKANKCPVALISLGAMSVQFDVRSKRILSNELNDVNLSGLGRKPLGPPFCLSVCFNQANVDQCLSFMEFSGVTERGGGGDTHTHTHTHTQKMKQSVGDEKKAERISETTSPKDSMHAQIT